MVWRIQPTDLDRHAKKSFGRRVPMPGYRAVAEYVPCLHSQLVDVPWPKHPMQRRLAARYGFRNKPSHTVP